MAESASPELVQLDRDHPGFRDLSYRARRNQIAALALNHVIGDPVPDVPYIAEEHGVWAQALQTLEPLHQRHACKEFLEHWPTLNFPRDRIPRFAEVNAHLAQRSGYSLSPVAGLVQARVFLEHLERGIFLCTQYIRHHSAPGYTPEPDVIHELVGHAALLGHPRFAAINRKFGEAARVAAPKRLEDLIRVYWYGMEFGVVREQGALKAMGAGLLSSAGEISQFEQRAQLRPFSIEAAAATPYDPTNYQQILFVAEGTDALLTALERWLAAG